VRSRGWDVDQVITDSGAGNRTQSRCECKQIRRHPLSTGDQGVNFPEKRQDLLARQRKVSLRVNDLEARSFENLPKPTRLVSKEIGADQHSGHGHLGVGKGMIASVLSTRVRVWTICSFGCHHRLASSQCPTYSHRTWRATLFCRRSSCEILTWWLEQ